MPELWEAGNVMPSLDELKSDAAVLANQVEIDWERLNNLQYRKEFLTVLEKAKNLLPDLEDLYTNLQQKLSVLDPKEPSSLSYDEIEKYTDIVGEELMSAYILNEVYYKYQMVENVLKASLDNPE